MKKPRRSEDSKKRMYTYLRFSNIAIQMAILITLAALGGRWLDERQGNEIPVWTLVLILIAIFASLWQIIKTVLKISKDEERDKEE